MHPVWSVPVRQLSESRVCASEIFMDV
jgi:hypothetical protein